MTEQQLWAIFTNPLSTVDQIREASRALDALRPEPVVSEPVAVVALAMRADAEELFTA